MNIQIPLEVKSQEKITRLLTAPIKSIGYSTDESQINAEGGDIALVVHVEGARGWFQFYGRSNRALQRHDVPQIEIEEVSAQQTSSLVGGKYIHLAATTVTHAFLLWKKEEYLGNLEPWPASSEVIYVNGLMLKFGHQLSLIIAASNSEPDLLILSEKKQIFEYLSKSHSAELFFAGSQNHDPSDP